MFMAILLVILAVGSVIFHLVSPWWFTPIASNWGSFDDAIVLTFWITGVVYVAVILFMAYCLYRYRYRADRRSDYDPENTKLELWLTGLTSLGVVGLLTPGLLAWNDFVTVPENAVKVEVVGKQWEWSFRLPGNDGVLGTTNIRNIDDDNSFGVNPKDPNGQDDILIEGEDLHIALGQPIKLLLRATDVLHDFYVPQFRAKMDMVPGMITYFWMTPTRTGTFDILCAEYCGVGHYEMRGRVVVESPEDYQKWLSDQTTFAQAMAKARQQSAGGVEMAATAPNPDAGTDGAAR
jgi:cytochrome c oxidase subunit 2